MFSTNISTVYVRAAEKKGSTVLKTSVQQEREEEGEYGWAWNGSWKRWAQSFCHRSTRRSRGRQFEDHTEFRCVTRNERKWLTIISDGDSTVGGRSLLNTPLSFDVSIITDKNSSLGSSLLFFLFFSHFYFPSRCSSRERATTILNLALRNDLLRGKRTGWTLMRR